MEMYEKAVYISSVLNSRAEDLDIPESKYLEAKSRYEAVGKWLGQEGTDLSKYDIEIYPQGSFRLGTVVKPIGRDEYDIDLVCFLSNLRKEETSQAELKKRVGDRIKENETYKKLLEDDEGGRRCWTLDYANEFHMDILPSIEDAELRSQDIKFKDAILITDKKKIESGDPEWPKSNPKGFADWFFQQQMEIFQSRKKALAETIKASVEDVPDYKVRTPLQRAIQILKRHRDIYFLKKDGKNKPISIIITTLMASLYEGQDNVFNVVYDVLNKVSDDLLRKDGKYAVSNPVNPGENFADKWNEDSSLPKVFFEWIGAAKNTFCGKALDQKDKMEIGAMLNESMGFSKDKAVTNESTSKPVYVKTSGHKNNQPWQAESN